MPFTTINPTAAPRASGCDELPIQFAKIGYVTSDAYPCMSHLRSAEIKKRSNLRLSRHGASLRVCFYGDFDDLMVLVPDAKDLGPEADLYFHAQGLPPELLTLLRRARREDLDWLLMED